VTDPWWLPYLSVPCCGGPAAVSPSARATDGAPAALRELPSLSCQACGAGYPIEDGIIRFGETSDYAGSFGLQWQTFAETQIDDLNGTTISRDFLTEVAGGSLDLFGGAVAYDAGCGAGRYSAVAAAHGARVIAADLSLGALRAARRNLERYPDVVLVHADARRAPVRPSSVDVALSIGVYQHAPEPLSYVHAVAGTVQEGGSLVLWGYERRWQSYAHPKYLLRPLTRRRDPQRLLRRIERLAPSLLRVSDALRSLPGGRVWSRTVPVANYRGILPLDDRQRHEWAVLDTFDWLSPRYDRPLTYDRIENALEARGFRLTRTVTNSIGFVARRGGTEPEGAAALQGHRLAGLGRS
jgi:SAM-dependent methyltransferase